MEVFMIYLRLKWGFRSPSKTKKYSLSDFFWDKKNVEITNGLRVIQFTSCYQHKKETRSREIVHLADGTLYVGDPPYKNAANPCDPCCHTFCLSTTASPVVSFCTIFSLKSGASSIPALAKGIRSIFRSHSSCGFYWLSAIGVVVSRATLLELLIFGQYEFQNGVAKFVRNLRLKVPVFSVL